MRHECAPSIAVNLICGRALILNLFIKIYLKRLLRSWIKKVRTAKISQKLIRPKISLLVKCSKKTGLSFFGPLWQLSKTFEGLFGTDENFTIMFAVWNKISCCVSANKRAIWIYFFERFLEHRLVADHFLPPRKNFQWDRRPNSDNLSFRFTLTFASFRTVFVLQRNFWILTNRIDGPSHVWQNISTISLRNVVLKPCASTLFCRLWWNYQWLSPLYGAQTEREKNRKYDSTVIILFTLKGEKN